MFPLVAGHEIIGIVDSIGSDVENLKVDEEGEYWSCRRYKF